MGTVFTPFLNLSKPAPGSLANTWGTVINANFDLIDAGVQANANAASAIPGMQGQIITLQSSDAAQNSNIATLESQVATLQGQIAALQASDATQTSNIATLQTQMATVQSQIITLLAQVSNVSWYNVGVNNGSSMVGNWVVFRFAPNNGNATEIGFGYGTGQEGDVIQIPASFTNYYMMAFIYQAVPAYSIFDFVITLSGLTITQCRTYNSANNPIGRGTVFGQWQGMCWRNHA